MHIYGIVSEDEYKISAKTESMDNMLSALQNVLAFDRGFYMISDDKLISFPIFYPYAHLRYQLPNPRQRHLSGSSQRSVHL